MENVFKKTHTKKTSKVLKTPQLHYWKKYGQNQHKLFNSFDLFIVWKSLFLNTPEDDKMSRLLNLKFSAPGPFVWATLVI